jgi:hypothetical protein
MDLSQLKKVETPSPRAQQQVPEDTVLSAILKVRKPGYRPAQVKVRANIGPHMFTGEFLARELAALEQDPQVETVSLNRRLPLEKPV